MKRLVLMLKYPQPGAVKTRLIPALGEARAAEIYRAMVGQTLSEARRFASAFSASMTAHVAKAPDGEALGRWLGEGIQVEPQGEGDLGQRMKRAAQRAFSEGAACVVLIGADCPE